MSFIARAFVQETRKQHGNQREGNFMYLGRWKILSVGKGSLQKCSHSASLFVDCSCSPSSAVGCGKPSQNFRRECVVWEDIHKYT